jgi:hypothetical protein
MNILFVKRADADEAEAIYVTQHKYATRTGLNFLARRWVRENTKDARSRAEVFSLDKLDELAQTLTAGYYVFHNEDETEFRGIQLLDVPVPGYIWGHYEKPERETKEHARWFSKCEVPTYRYDPVDEREILLR